VIHSSSWADFALVLNHALFPYRFFNTVAVGVLGAWLGDINYMHTARPSVADSLALGPDPTGVWFAAAHTPPDYDAERAAVGHLSATAAAAAAATRTEAAAAPTEATATAARVSTHTKRQAALVQEAAPSRVFPLEVCAAAVELTSGSLLRAMTLVQTLDMALYCTTGVRHEGALGRIVPLVGSGTPSPLVQNHHLRGSSGQVVVDAVAATSCRSSSRSSSDHKHGSTDDLLRLLHIANNTLNKLGPSADATMAASLLRGSGWDPVALDAMTTVVHRALRLRSAADSARRFSRLLRRAGLGPWQNKTGATKCRDTAREMTETVEQSGASAVAHKIVEDGKLDTVCAQPTPTFAIPSAPPRGDMWVVLVGGEAPR
jgi:hypothetical protein